MLCDILKDYVEQKITLRPQDEACATICHELTREDGRVSLLSDTAVGIERKLRAYSPWPGIWTEVKHGQKTLRVKILKAKVVNNTLQIIELQPEGGKPMTLNTFKNGYP